MHKRPGSSKEVKMLESFKPKRHFILGSLALLLILVLYLLSNSASERSPYTGYSTRSLFPLFPITSNGVVPTLKVSVVASFYHNESHFTQGFEILDGYLYEGTGMNAQSALMKKNLTTGKILMIRQLADRYFGEGITIFGDKIYQLTWKDHVGFFYDKATLQLIGSWNYDYDGWGLTHDNYNLIVSDGTSLIRYLDPRGDLTKAVRTITVKYPGGKEQRNLNELEYIDGNIWANVWLTHFIVVINPATGLIVAKIDLTDIRKSGELSGDVLNGIAFDSASRKMYVTGKYWKKMYEIIPVA
jgi:glutamine cyclotransferase